jgi:hypothetical protein
MQITGSFALILSMFLSSLLSVARQSSSQAAPAAQSTEAVKPSPTPEARLEQDASYFQAQAFGDPAMVQVFTKFLARSGEPSLYKLISDHEAHSYRLLWLTPAGRLVTVRLSVLQEGGGTLFTKVLTGSRGARYPDTVLVNRQTSVSKKEVAQLLDLMASNQFWSLSETAPAPRVLDGEFWLLEGVRNGKYHAAYRYSPQPGLYTRIGRYLAKDLARLDDSIISIASYPADQ